MGMHDEGTTGLSWIHDVLMRRMHMAVHLRGDESRFLITCPPRSCSTATASSSVLISKGRSLALFEKACETSISYRKETH